MTDRHATDSRDEDRATERHSLVAYTPDEVRDRLLDRFRGIARYWAELPGKTKLQVAEGVAFSMLAVLDGCEICLPGFDLVARPHEDDREWHRSRGERWIEDGTVVRSFGSPGKMSR